MRDDVTIVPAGRRSAAPAPALRWAPWALLAVLGPLPAIVFHVGTGRVPEWLVAGQALAGLAVTLVIVFADALRPLWRFAVVMTAVTVLPTVSGLWDLSLGGVQQGLGGGPFNALLQPGQTAKLVVAAAVIGLLLLLQIRPRDFFLRAGHIGAVIRPVPALGFPKPDSWRRFGLIWGVGIAAALGAAQYVLLRPSAEELAAVLSLVPAVLLYAALNALTEEVTYRAPLIATLEPVAGSTQALWVSAVSFGIAHYFGTPGGIVGALLSIFMGWILGKAMIETRGLFWPWLIHFFSDVVIFVFLAASLSMS